MRVRVFAILVFLLLPRAGLAQVVVTPALQDATAGTDLTLQQQSFTLSGVYTGSTYGPGNAQIVQFATREDILTVGRTLLRISLPRLATINRFDSGFSDMQMYYIPTHRLTQLRWGLGLTAVIPVASNPNFGTGKWTLGPAGGILSVRRGSNFIFGALMQSAFSIAGPSARRNQSAISFQPLLFLRLPGGRWYLKSADSLWAFDLQRGSSIVPLSLGFGTLARLGSGTVNISLADEGTVIHANSPMAPKNSLKLQISILYAKGYPPPAWR
ncbi:MAG: hypothetical protein JOZ38_08215 [Candidatus Eremiobacteraeota bacterium]|nr:hypothetical protein [Candidatus Eremiobacteraeota bacterium]